MELTVAGVQASDKCSFHAITAAFVTGCPFKNVIKLFTSWTYFLTVFLVHPYSWRCAAYRAMWWEVMVKAVSPLSMTAVSFVFDADSFQNRKKVIPK